MGTTGEILPQTPDKLAREQLPDPYIGPNYNPCQASFLYLRILLGTTFGLVVSKNWGGGAMGGDATGRAKKIKSKKFGLDASGSDMRAPCRTYVH